MAVFGVVLVVDGVVDELEAVPRGEVADAALAGEGFADLVFALLAQFGVALDFGRVSTVVGALGVVVFEAFGERDDGVTGAVGLARSRLSTGGVLAHMGGDGLVVVTGELGVAGLDAAGTVPVVDGVAAFDTVGAVVADGAVGVVFVVGGGAVEEDEGVLGDAVGVGFVIVVGVAFALFTATAFAALPCPDAGIGVGAVGVAGVDAFFGEQAFDEG